MPKKTERKKCFASYWACIGGGTAKMGNIVFDMPPVDVPGIRGLEDEISTHLEHTHKVDCKVTLISWQVFGK